MKYEQLDIFIDEADGVVDLILLKVNFRMCGATAELLESYYRNNGLEHASVYAERDILNIGGIHKSELNRLYKLTDKVNIK